MITDKTYFTAGLKNSASSLFDLLISLLIYSFVYSLCSFVRSYVHFFIYILNEFFGFRMKHVCPKRVTNDLKTLTVHCVMQSALPDHGKLQSGQPQTQPRFEPSNCTYRIKVTLIIVLTCLTALTFIGTEPRFEFHRLTGLDGDFRKSPHIAALTER
jgi:hypothetical protein